jgi:hypothetical protein
MYVVIVACDDVGGASVSASGSVLNGATGVGVGGLGGFGGLGGAGGAGVGGCHGAVIVNR